MGGQSHAPPDFRAIAFVAPLRGPGAGAAESRLNLHMLMRTLPIAMAVLMGDDPRRNDMQIAMAHAALAGNGMGEALDTAERPFQHRNLQTVVMIEMNVKGGDREVMPLVMRVGQSPR